MKVPLSKIKCMAMGYIVMPMVMSSRGNGKWAKGTAEANSKASTEGSKLEIGSMMNSVSDFLNL